MKFYRCKRCGQIVAMVNETGVPIICCGAEMQEITPKTRESGLTEKHLPDFKIVNRRLEVKIGEIPHPMTNDHYIEWIALVTNKGNQRKCLKPGDAPYAAFMLDKDEEVKEIYEYCNLHSLWKKEII